MIPIITYHLLKNRNPLDTCPEGPATDHLDTGFLSWFPCVLKANAEVVPKYPRCHYMLLM